MYGNFPPVAYTVLNSTGELVRINRGESGFSEFIDINTGKKIYGLDALKRAESLNAQLGITDWRVRFAMEMGSCFGWEVPGANPETYKDIKEDGLPKLAAKWEKHYQKLAKKRKVVSIEEAKK